MASSFSHIFRVRGAGLRKAAAFSLIELLVVIAIISVMMGLVIPSIGSIQNGEDVTKAAYDISGVLENARSFAMANNTYVWVGFFEEDGSKASSNPAVAGVGRVVVSAVASKDGTMIYDSSSSSINPAGLTQLNRIVKIQNAHLTSFMDGSGTGLNFDGRPAAASNDARIGDNYPSNPTPVPFRYPLGTNAGTPQYTFSKTIQFNPRGENTVNSTYPMKPVVEIGLLPTRGSIVDTNNKNVAAIQITGVGGNVKIYRR